MTGMCVIECNRKADRSEESKKNYLKASRFAKKIQLQLLET